MRKSRFAKLLAAVAPAHTTVAALAFAVAGIALAFAIAGAARADSLPDGAQARWGKYFPGDAHVPDPELQLEQLLDSPDDCRSLQRSIVESTIAYGRAAYKNKNGAARKQANTLLATLHGIEASGSCFDSVARAYLATSLHLLSPTNSNDGNYLNNLRVDNRPVPLGLELTLLGVALLNERRGDGHPLVELLTESRRGTEESLWTKKTRDGKSYLVSAGYDCLARGILIDPYLPPLNLAAVFVHEIDHLFRDRVARPLNNLEKLAADLRALNEKLYGVAPPADPLAGNLPLAITQDETLASAMAAYSQRHMRWFRDFHAPLIPWLANSKGSHPLPFQLNDDLSLFRSEKHSPVNVIWSLLQQGHPEVNNQINPTAAYFLSKTFLTADYPGQPLSQTMLDAVNQIYRTIHAGYFDGSTLSADELALLDPRLHGLDRDSLAAWLQRYLVDVQTGDQNPLPPGLWMREVAANRYAYGTSGQHPTVQIGFGLTELFNGLDFAFEQIRQPDDLSPYCRRYLSGLDDGELATYVGNRLSSFQPGETGVKPGETGVKPGETGVKPGETGVKPGETGVKPAALIRPCLNIGPEI